MYTYAYIFQNVTVRFLQRMRAVVPLCELWTGRIYLHSAPGRADLWDGILSLRRKSVTGRSTERALAGRRRSVIGRDRGAAEVCAHC